jgi:hypothetical protein
MKTWNGTKASIPSDFREARTAAILAARFGAGWHPVRATS